MSVQNKMVPVLSLFLRDFFTLIFLRMLKNLIVTWRSELKRDVSNRIISKCYCAMSNFLVNNFCTYCSNVDQSPS